MDIFSQLVCLINFIKDKICVVKTHSQEVFKQYTGIFAISTKGILGWKLYDKWGINSEKLYDFLQQHITSKYKNKRFDKYNEILY